MSQTILMSWTQDGASEFVYSAPYDPSDFDPGNLESVIPASSSANDGEYQNNSFLSARTLTLKGTIMEASLGGVQGDLNTLFGAHPRGGRGKLRQQLIDSVSGSVISDLFMYARVSQRQAAPVDGRPRRDWTIGYRSPSPLWQEWTARTLTLISSTLADSGSGASASASWTPGGAEAVLPVFSVVVATPGTVPSVTITPTTVFGLDSPPLLTFAPDAADTWTIDCEKKVLSRAGAAGVNQNDKITAGGFFQVPPTANTITASVAAGSGTSVTNVSVQWRRRFAVI